MYQFGGMYADLDLECLKPLGDLFHPRSPSDLVRTAYVARMGQDPNFEHSIPNAFMASDAPFHKFWLKPVAFIKEQYDLDKKSQWTAWSKSPEELTGPIPLWKLSRTFQKEGNLLVVLDPSYIFPCMS